MKELYLDNRLFTGTEEEFLAIKEFKWKEWCQNGEYHRVGGPALIQPDGFQFWYQNGEYHRTDGPAITHPDRDQEYWIKGRRLTEEEYTKEIKENSQQNNKTLYNESFKEYVIKSLNLNENEDLYQQIDKISKKLKEQKELDSIFNKP